MADAQAVYFLTAAAASAELPPLASTLCAAAMASLRRWLASRVMYGPSLTMPPLVAARAAAGLARGLARWRAEGISGRWKDEAPSPRKGNARYSCSGFGLLEPLEEPVRAVDGRRSPRRRERLRERVQEATGGAGRLGRR